METVREVAGRRQDAGRPSPPSASPTSARRWWRGTGPAAVRLHRAIVWQDRRTAERCDELRAEGHLPVVRERTGLVLDPYFSGTKMEWLLGPGGVPVTDDLVLGTVDAWLIWNLTGGPTVGSSPPMPPTPRGPCSTTSGSGRGPTSCATSSASLGPRSLDVAPSCGRFGVVRGALADAGADRWRAWR